MKKFFIFLLFVPAVLFAQKRDSVNFKNRIFEGVYSEVLEQPLVVRYKIQCPDGTASRKGMDFFKNDSIHTSDHNDYKANVWDKGHLAPAADFTCDLETLKMTFSYLNCALQHQSLNRGVWKSLESHERELAIKHGDVYVEIRVHFAKGAEVLPTGATVPVGFTKKIKVGDKLYGVWYFPNVLPESKEHEFYKVK